MSDGSNRLTFRDPQSFESIGQVAITADGQAVDRLNELECVGDRVYANVWMTDTIVRIDPATGQVEAIIDALGLLSADERRGADVLNGIAYDPADGAFLITGKLWPKPFRVNFVP
jgi:glutaminyl-peptide cyclotransferase